VWTRPLPRRRAFGEIVMPGLVPGIFVLFKLPKIPGRSGRVPNERP
jgi:hypothetical protein